MKGTLFLLPTPLGGDWEEVITPYVAQITRSLKYYIVEDIRSARRYLSKLSMPVAIDELNFELLNEHTPTNFIHDLIKPILQGQSVGLLSEAGLPAVADPGTGLIALAHENDIKIVPLTGPNSIILALMGSGLNGQNFAFVGYLPIKPNERVNRIKQLEQRSKEEKQTQLFIEAPYRNNQLLESLVKTLQPETLLNISCDITLPTEFVCTMRVKNWKKKMPNLHKRPSIFAIQSF